MQRAGSKGDGDPGVGLSLMGECGPNAHLSGIFINIKHPLPIWEAKERFQQEGLKEADEGYFLLRSSGENDPAADQFKKRASNP